MTFGTHNEIKIICKSGFNQLLMGHWTQGPLTGGFTLGRGSLREHMAQSEPFYLLGKPEHLCRASSGHFQAEVPAVFSGTVWFLPYVSRGFGMVCGSFTPPPPRKKIKPFPSALTATGYERDYKGLQLQTLRIFV